MSSEGAPATDGDEGRKRLLAGRKLTGNGLILLTALYGLVGWGQTAYVVHLLWEFELGRTTPAGTAVSFREVGPWIQVVTQYTGQLMLFWVALTVALVVLVALFGEDGVALSGPSITWGVGIVVAMGVTAYGLDAQAQYLVWLPWLALYAVAYLVTGALVTRGGVYYVAGAVSALLTAYGVFAVVTRTGTLVLTTETTVAAQVPLAGAVLVPFPYVYVVLGVLHVVPMAVDGLRGGRQMVEEGVPKLKAERHDETETAGGVIES